MTDDHTSEFGKFAEWANSQWRNQKSDCWRQTHVTTLGGGGVREERTSPILLLAPKTRVTPMNGSRVLPDTNNSHVNLGVVFFLSS